jgi:hypothetical protein
MTKQRKTTTTTFINLRNEIEKFKKHKNNKLLEKLYIVCMKFLQYIY